MIVVGCYCFSFPEMISSVGEHVFDGVVVIECLVQTFESLPSDDELGTD